MPKSRPPYPAEFRQQMVELVAAGRTLAEMSRELGCRAQTIINWAAGSGVKVDAPRLIRRSAAPSVSNLRGCGARTTGCRWSATSWQRLRPGPRPRATRRSRRLRARERETSWLPRVNDVPRAGDIVSFRVSLANGPRLK
jgi:hypothetical protein